MNSTPLSLETLAVRVTALEHEINDQKKEMQNVVTRLESVETGHGLVKADLSNIRDLCNEIKADVKELKEKPVRKLDTISTAVMQWLILAILGAVLIFK